MNDAAGQSPNGSSPETGKPAARNEAALPAAAYMAMDIARNLLDRAEKPDLAGKYLAEEMRELTGAKAVVLVEFSAPSSAQAYHVVSVCPERRLDLALRPEMRILYEKARGADGGMFWRVQELPGAAGQLLQIAGYANAASLPLQAGAARVGALIFVDLPEDKPIEALMEYHETLTAIAALVLHHAFLFKNQEAIIAERTAEIRRLNDTLERRVRERTATLEQTLSELEAFSYSVSHDLRTPLRGISGFSELLFEEYGDRLDEPGRNYLERIQNAACRMGSLIDDLLRLSRITRGEMRLGPADLSRLAGEILVGLHQNEPQRAVQTEVGRDIVAPFADPGLIRIALENLLLNAWKFTRDTPHARIEFGQTALDGRVVYYVRDNGVGFDMAGAGALFRPFQRLHSDGNYEGSGIGLAIAQRVILRHGGRIWAESAPGKGATFFFHLWGETPAPQPSTNRFTSPEP